MPWILVLLLTTQCAALDFSEFDSSEFTFNDQDFGTTLSTFASAVDAIKSLYSATEKFPFDFNKFKINVTDVFTRYMPKAVTNFLISRKIFDAAQPSCQVIAKSITKKELEAADMLFGYLFSLGDANFGGLPDSFEKMETFCSKHLFREKLFREFVLRSFPNNSRIQQALDLIDFTFKNDQQCKDGESRMKFIEGARGLNKYLGSMSLAHAWLIDLMTTLKRESIANKINSDDRTRFFCCGIWKFVEDCFRMLPDIESFSFGHDLFFSYFRRFTEYLCPDKYRKDSVVCRFTGDYPTSSPTDGNTADYRPKSMLLAVIQVIPFLANLTET